MEAIANKESRLNIRCNTHARELLDRAATYAHMSVSEFVFSCLGLGSGSTTGIDHLAARRLCRFSGHA